MADSTRRVLRVRNPDPESDDDPTSSDEDIVDDDSSDDWSRAAEMAKDEGYDSYFVMRLEELGVLAERVLREAGEDYTNLKPAERRDPPKLLRTYESLMRDALEGVGYNDAQLWDAKAYGTIHRTLDHKRMQSFAPKWPAIKADRITPLVEGNFKFVATLGIGGQGHAGLWATGDGSGRIAQRIVMKECFHTSDRFRNCEVIWQGKIEDMYPREAYFHKTVADRIVGDDDQVIVPLLAYEVYPHHAMYRIVMAYCPHGDLDSTTTIYNKLKEVYNHAQLRSQYFRIPIPALWRIFQAMARAVSILDRGYYPGQEKPKEKWRSIIHRDLKPPNVFLSTIDSSDSNMPIPQVGDFGLAIHADDENAQEAGIGTDGYMAPEQYKLGLRIIDTSVDIWAVGRIMHMLMEVVLDEDVRQTMSGRPTTFPLFSEECIKDYPARLIALVQSCLSERHRPTADELCNAIDIEIEDLKNMAMDGDNGNDVESQLWKGQFLYEADRYATWGH